MDKEMLYRFFEGKCFAVSEGKTNKIVVGRLRKENHRLFFQERKMFDVLLCKPSSNKTKKKSQIFTWLISTVALWASTSCIMRIILLNA